MGRRLPAAFAALLLLGALPAVAVPAIAANPDTARHDAVVAHWTAERLASAKPRDIRLEAGRAAGPKAKPGGGGGNVTGASWTKGGAIFHASGKVYFEMAGSAWVCSGTAATDSRSGYSLVLTAGHCAYDEDNGAFATNWLFIPEFDSAPTFTCASTKWGCWTAQALVVHDGFASAGSFNTQATTHDFAFAVVGGGGKSGTAQLDATVGSLPIAFSGVSSGSVLDAFGYPAAGKYHGNDLTYCQGPVSPDSLNQSLTWGMSCDMTGGSSGGPWLSGFDAATGSGTLSSLNSYGYSGIRSMYGPKFNTDTSAVFNAADGATSNTIVR
ncbi:MAG: trypsin-like serine peptidase [Chloroflexota bacterium]